MQRAPNTALARLLAESQWNHRQFVRAVNRAGTEAGVSASYGPPSVVNWLKGTVPRKEVPGLIVEALSRRLRRPVTRAEAGFPVPANAASPPPSTVDGLLDLGRQDMDPSRRSVLGAALFSVALTIPGWPDVVGRAEAAANGRTQHVGMGEVRMVTNMTERVSELDDQFGGRTARPMAAAFLVNTVTPYLRLDASDEVRKALLSAASDLCYLTGYMAVDEGLHGLAQRYYLKALELAGQAADHLTYCTTLRGMSVQAVDLGHGPHAMHLADAAAAASPQAGPRMRAFLAGQQAHSAAQVGNKRDAMRYMHEAERAMDQAESQTKAFGSYDPSALHYHLSRVRTELGDLNGAIGAAQESDRLRYSVYRRNAVRTRGMTAEIMLRAGRLDESVAMWNQALDDYPLVQSGRCDERMREMQRLLLPHTRNAGAKQLYERSRALVPAT